MGLSCFCECGLEVGIGKWKKIYWMTYLYKWIFYTNNHILHFHILRLYSCVMLCSTCFICVYDIWKAIMESNLPVNIKNIYKKKKGRRVKWHIRYSVAPSLGFGFDKLLLRAFNNSGWLSNQICSYLYVHPFGQFHNWCDKILSGSDFLGWLSFLPHW